MSDKDNDSKESKKNSVSSFTHKHVKNVSVPVGVTHVFVTSDGQVFFPENEALAKKHAERKKLEIHLHKM